MLANKIIQTLAVSLLASTGLAHPVAHLHHQHAKREVVHVTETVVVTVGGSEASTVQLVHADPSAVTASTPTQNAQVVPTATTSYTPASTTSAESTSSESSTSSSSSSASKPTSTGDFTGGSKGVTYSPYSSSGACKSLSEVQSDLEKLSDYGLIRLYGVDCNQVENVLQAKGDDQKLFLGIYYVDAIADGISEIKNAVEKYGSWDDIDTISIGNELVNAGTATPSDIKNYISQAKSALSGSGFSGSLVSVDTHVAIIANPDLCEYSDYIAFSAHAYWDGTIYPDGAGDWLLLQMQRVWSACDGKKTVMCAESGWPHSGDSFGVAVPSSENQATAIKSLKSSVGNDVILFNAFDDLWKAPGSYNVEQFWGFSS
ncbi:hypothetical protein OGAPHI_000593 [Ogataea philodendri]|uniref:Family 17 glucosidase SCW4 n=1 Tax=Ogataea philodendri TaxID=1378263 RepID=A0A9P8PFG2_9ASCO|nr:uncharacterized protein OGAPHI_000593 [Ogataea philodendri]KAH3670882.1 hypothetical protein OGAPHI_000593 [Ogataea philodendri]